MKQALIIGLFGFLFFACEKEEIEEPCPNPNSTEDSLKKSYSISGTLYNQFGDIEGVANAEEEAVEPIPFIFPNLVNSNGTLFFEGIDQNISVEIMDMNGRLVFNENDLNPQKGISLHETISKAGLYLVRVKTANKVLLNTKIAVQ